MIKYYMTLKNNFLQKRKKNEDVNVEFPVEINALNLDWRTYCIWFTFFFAWVADKEKPGALLHDKFKKLKVIAL